ncbi:hypothetical protein SAMN02745196_01737 [Clostridium collagenovorans DSM 3089]|uniref:Uncharacterized protein n=1 Tax=Clostridium collagenovorans DSM 3089 TaxID=1121306 RepID=A0A1M5WM92_9CLOT|nr:hypothetical protein [Clostridium collagenovorans]SHH88680.1 hypothetical protein SAMN02745196_01737 [Clostridium collagenovorans DSM 3089]
MNSKEKNDLFYVCSLIEFIGRKTKNRRADIVDIIGKKEISRQFDLAEVNHCLSFDEVEDEIIDYYQIAIGDFDSISNCKYSIPSVQSIGKVYERLISNTMLESDNIIDSIVKVFKSFISDEISDFNSSVYYSNPDYLKHSYLEGKLLA